MTPTDHDPYAGASQSAAEVRERAIGAEVTNPRLAKSDGYYTDGEGVRRQIVAGDPIPPGVELDGESSSSSSDAKAEQAPAENKARKAPESK